MKVFISWSGSLSKELGETLRDWLPAVLQAVAPYFTPSDIEKGTRWANDIAKELQSSSFGILCITRENISAPWILFEAGALSKRLEKTHNCPILLGISNADLSGPLKQFQGTAFDKNDVKQLINAINNRITEGKLNSKTLVTAFEIWWPDLYEKVSAILAKEAIPDQPIRPDRELLGEILLLSRHGSMQARKPGFNPKALADLTEKYIELHDQQSMRVGDYQETLDMIKTMLSPLEYLLRQASREVDGLVELRDRVSKLSFTTQDDGFRESDDIVVPLNEAPFWSLS